jgi:hypothetical protein
MISVRDQLGETERDRGRMINIKNKNSNSAHCATRIIVVQQEVPYYGR